jgi:hypothetical protein
MQLKLNNNLILLIKIKGMIKILSSCKWWDYVIMSSFV